MTATAELRGVTGVVQNIESKGRGVRENVFKAVNGAAYALVGYIQTQKLNGQVLKQRSGRLAASIHPEIKQTSGAVVATVGTNVKYAEPHEYGFFGTVQVKEYMRNQTMAWGRPITPMLVTVTAHPMRMNIPERSFLRSSLLENTDAINARIGTAVTTGVKA